METNIVVLTGLPSQTTREDIYVTLDPIGHISIDYMLYPFIYDTHTAIIKLKNSQDVSQLLVGQHVVNGQPIRVRPVPIQVYEECSSTVSPLIMAAIGNTAAVKRHLEADLGVEVKVNNGRLTIVGSLLQLQCAQARISSFYHQRQEREQRKLFRLGISNEFSASISDSLPPSANITPQASIDVEENNDTMTKPTRTAWTAENFKPKPSASPNVSVNLRESTDSHHATSLPGSLAISQDIGNLTSESMDIYQELLTKSITSQSLVLPANSSVDEASENLSHSLPTKLGADTKSQTHRSKQKQTKAPVVKRNTLVSPVPKNEKRTSSPVKDTKTGSTPRKSGSYPTSSRSQSKGKYRSLDEAELAAHKQNKIKPSRSSQSALSVQTLSLDIEPDVRNSTDKKKEVTKVRSSRNMNEDDTTKVRSSLNMSKEDWLKVRASQITNKDDASTTVTMELDKQVFNYLLLKVPGILAETESDYRVSITPHTFDNDVLLDIEPLDEIFAISAELAKDKLMTIYQKVFLSVKKETIIVEADAVKEKLLHTVVNQVSNDYKKDLVVDLDATGDDHLKVVVAGKKFYVTAALEYINKMLGSNPSPASSLRQVQTAKDIPKPQMVFMMHSQPVHSKQRTSQSSSKQSAEESEDFAALEKSGTSALITDQDPGKHPALHEVQATMRGFYDSLEPGAMAKYGLNTIDPLSQSNYLSQSHGEVDQSGTLTRSHDALGSTAGSFHEDAGMQASLSKPLRFTTKEGLRVTLSVGNLAEKEVDVIVNPAREDLHMTHGVSASLSDAAGPDLQMECTRYIVKHGHLHSSEVIHTGAGSGSLQCQHVVHAVVPMWCLHPDKVRGYEVLLSTVLNAFTHSNNELRASTLATTIMGTGLFGVPAEVCGQVMWDALHEYSENMLENARLRSIDIVDIDPMIVRKIQAYWHDLLQLEPGDNLASSSQLVPGENHQMVGSGPQMTSSGEQREAVSYHPLLAAASEISPINSLIDGLRHSEDVGASHASIDRSARSPRHPVRDSEEITADVAASVDKTPRHLVGSEDYEAITQAFNDHPRPLNEVQQSLDGESVFEGQNETLGSARSKDARRKPSTARSVVRSSVGEMMTPRDVPVGGSLTLSAGMNATMEEDAMDTPYSSINRLDVHQFVGQYVSDTILGAIGTMQDGGEDSGNQDDMRESVDTHASAENGFQKIGTSDSMLNGVELFDQTLVKTVVDPSEMAEYASKEDQNNNSSAVIPEKEMDESNMLESGEFVAARSANSTARGTTLDFLMHSFGAVKDGDDLAKSSPGSKHSTPRSNRSARSSHSHRSRKSEKLDAELDLVEACQAVVSHAEGAQNRVPQVDSAASSRLHSARSSKGSIHTPKASGNEPVSTNSARVLSRDVTPRGSTHSVHSSKRATPRGSVHSVQSDKQGTPRGSVHSMHGDGEATPRGSVHSMHGDGEVTPHGSVHSMHSTRHSTPRGSIHSVHSDKSATRKNSTHGSLSGGQSSPHGSSKNDYSSKNLIENNPFVSPEGATSQEAETTSNGAQKEDQIALENAQPGNDSVPLANPWSSPSGDLSSRTDKFNFDNLLSPKTPKSSSVSSTPRSARSASSQPKGGRINWEVDRRIRLPGYEDVGAIVITYSFSAGKKQGLSYGPTTKQAYLPNTPEGRKVLQGLRKAFLLGLVFKLHRAGSSSEIIWGDIPHKTDVDGVNGYPDVTYLDAVMTSLSELELI